MPGDRLAYLGIPIHDTRKACKLTQQELSDETGESIKMIQCIENGSVNPSHEILFPIVNRLGLTTSDLFSIEPDQHKEEINRFLGKVRACNRSNQLLLLDTLDFLAEQLLARQHENHNDTFSVFLERCQKDIQIFHAQNLLKLVCESEEKRRFAGTAAFQKLREPCE